MGVSWAPPTQHDHIEPPLSPKLLCPPECSGWKPGTPLSLLHISFAFRIYSGSNHSHPLFGSHPCHTAVVSCLDSAGASTLVSQLLHLSPTVHSPTGARGACEHPSQGTPSSALNPLWLPSHSEEKPNSSPFPQGPACSALSPPPCLHPLPLSPFLAPFQPHWHPGYTVGYTGYTVHCFLNFFTFIKGFDHEGFIKCHEILFAI